MGRAARRDARWLLGAGAFLGLGALSKLTAGALAVVALGAFATTMRGRALLRTPWAWGSAALVALVACPMLAWNASHGWANVAFQAHHGLRGGEVSLARLGGSVGGQAAYVSPLLLVACVWPAWRALWSGDPAIRSIAWSALPVALFFTAAAAFTPGALPHWPAPAWLSAVVLLAVEGSPMLRAAALTGAALQAAAAIALAVPFDFPGDPREAGSPLLVVAVAGLVRGARSWSAASVRSSQRAGGAVFPRGTSGRAPRARATNPRRPAGLRP